MSKKLLIVSLLVLSLSTMLVGCNKDKGAEQDTGISMESEDLSADELGDFEDSFTDEEFSESSLDGDGIDIEDSLDSTLDNAVEEIEPVEEQKKDEKPAKKKEKITVGDIKIPGGM